MNKDSTITEISKKYGKSVSQVILNWHLKNDHIVFPKMHSKEHLMENTEIFDFKLDDNDY